MCPRDEEEMQDVESMEYPTMICERHLPVCIPQCWGYMHAESRPAFTRVLRIQSSCFQKYSNPLSHFHNNPAPNHFQSRSILSTATRVYNSGILEALEGSKGSLDQVDSPSHQMGELTHGLPSAPLSPPTTPSPTLHAQELNPSPPIYPTYFNLALKYSRC